jgi:hypothetical protein
MTPYKKREAKEINSGVSLSTNYFFRNGNLFQKSSESACDHMQNLFWKEGIFTRANQE